MGQRSEPGQRLGNPIAPVTEHPAGGRAGPRLGRTQHPAEEIGRHHIVPLVHPQCFHELVFMSGIVTVEARHPTLHRGDHLPRIVPVQLELGPFAHLVLRFLEQLEQRFDGLTVDGRSWEQRPALVGDPVNPPMPVVPVGVPQMMLHVPDDRLVPVGKVNGAVRTGGDGDGTKIRIARFNQMFQRPAHQPGSFLGDIHPKNAAKPDDIQIEKIPLKLVGEMPAGQQPRRRTRTRGPAPEFPHRRVLGGIIEMSAEGRTEIGVVARRIGHQVVAPSVEHSAMRIGEAVGDIRLESARAWLESVDGAVVVAHRTPGRLDLGTMKYPVTQIHCPARIQTDRVGGMMRIRRIQPHQHPLPPIGAPIPSGIPHPPKIRRLHHQHTPPIKLKSRRRIQII